MHDVVNDTQLSQSTIKKYKQNILYSEIAHTVEEKQGGGGG